MPSHLSDVGFYISEENSYDELVRVFADLQQKTSKEIVVGNRKYIVLCADEDIEFWIPVVENGILDPDLFELHFNTHRWLDIKWTSWVSKTCCDMQGIVSLWEKDAGYPFNITVPNAICVPELQEEKIYKAQIACFAEEFDVYKNEDEYYNEHAMSTQAFIPIGSSSIKEDKLVSEENQTSHVWFSGTVREIKYKTNSYTNNDYYHLLIDGCDDVAFDVLVDARSVESIEVGNIVSVVAWLSGKIEPCY